jgi:hypothetical protein
MILQLLSAVIACDKRKAFAPGSASDEAIHSATGTAMDCFVELVIGRRFAPTRWLAMTENNDRRHPELPSGMTTL